MELETQAIDRVLEALGPTLSREIERLLQQAQQNLEAQFRQKLEAAVQEAEASSRRVAEVRIEHAAVEARESVRTQLTNEFERLRAQLEERFQEASTEWAAERERLTKELAEAQVFAEGQQRLAKAGSQGEMLVSFLQLTERFAPSVAVYIVKPNGLSLWKTRGDADFPKTVSQTTIDPTLFYREVTVRDTLVLAVCAMQPVKAAGLDFLMASLQRSIELFGSKLRGQTPKTVGSGS